MDRHKRIVLAEGGESARSSWALAFFLTLLVGSIGALGCRFSGASLQSLASMFWKGSGATVLVMSVALAAAVTLKYLTGIPASVVLLAFAPGGIAEMTLVALGLGVDVAFVTAHHLARVVVVFVLAPALFRGIARLRRPQPE